jgi:2-amino-4-hydroxy-6-hydroxymethyldihydropteridine diphosphokinase
VLLGLGANLGEPLLQLRRAVERLGEILAVQAVSSVYRTEPVGLREQPDFFNLVVRGRARLGPLRTMREILRLEAELGRERSAPNAPRTIDIDLLAHGDRTRAGAELVLPHPRLHERAFVLVPLREVAPDWVHPRLGLSAEELLRRAGPQPRVERWGSLAGPHPSTA